MSEIAFDPVLNYVETIGEGLKTPKRRPKQRKDGSSTPHPIITRRASFKSVRSEVSAWTEDEGELGRKSPCERGETRRGSEELEGERTPKGDSAYGSRGSIQSPHSIHELTGVSDDEKVFVVNKIMQNTFTKKLKRIKRHFMRKFNYQLY